MHYISDVLYWISTGLLVPVIILLIYFFLRSLILIGSFFGQYLDTRKTGASLKKELSTLKKEEVETFISKLPQNHRLLSVYYLHQMWNNKDHSAKINKLLTDFELDADKDLAISKTLTKMGPMLGLMGTLIPMGPALVGLSTGDIASMAYNMQVAFATTVVGLFSSAIGFITQQVKQRWYLQDMNNLEFFAELLKENQTK